MTPSKKASELISDFQRHVIYKRQAIDMAVICVREILSVSEHGPYNIHCFWKVVMRDLNNIEDIS